MKRLAAWIIIVGGGLGSLRAGDPGTLEPGVATPLYVAPGRATTVLLKSDRKVAAISLASPVISYKYDKALNQLEITPAVRTGGLETNLNLRIGDDVYVLLVRVVTDVRAEWVRTFLLPDARPGGDEAGLAGARPLAPAEVDLVAAAQTMERAEHDAVFRAQQGQLRLVPLPKVKGWNDCAIALDAVAQFIDLDLLVFRVRWTNTTADALYLHPTQVAIWAAGTRIPLVGSYSPQDAVVMPGERAQVYLAAQGLRLSRKNDWDLGLPPEGKDIARMVATGGGP